MIKYLNQKYSHENFKRFSLEFFKEYVFMSETSTKVPSQYALNILDYRIFGKYSDSNGNNVAIISVRITEGSNARTAQRNFISWLLSKGDLNNFDSALVAFYDEERPTWKLSFVYADYEVEKNKVKLKFKPAKRFSFLVGESEPHITYTKQLAPILESNIKPSLEEISEAFSVNKVTEDFYKGYYENYKRFKKHLLNNQAFINESKRIGYKEPDKFAVIFTKKTLGQIVFLYFIQKKGWLGVPIKSDWGQGDQKYILNTAKTFTNKNIFNDFLEPLFYNGLNTKRENDLFNETKIPFLNGGLFHPLDNYNWKETDFSIPNEYWLSKNEDGFLDLLNQYNFTVYESDPDEQEVAIDPEMLGRIFESLLEDNDRKEKGAFYTPREIVQYMCVESLSYSISSELGIDYDSIKNYILYNDALSETETIQSCADVVDEYIANLKIVDPAVGSGAFLVGMLTEIVKLRLNLSQFIIDNTKASRYNIKKDCIQNSLYGVDIEADAIEIAKLRLWLSLVVEQDNREISEPQPLPNLAFSLRVGNSLVHKINGISLEVPSWHKSSIKGVQNLGGMNIFNWNETSQILEEIKEIKTRYNLSTNDDEKNILQNKIEDLYLRLIKIKLIEQNRQDIFQKILDMKNQKTKPYFLWEYEFEEVFEKNKGFDIVIANPPYIQLQKNKGKLANELVEQNFKTFERTGDIYCLFYEQGVNILRDNGILTYITSNKWMRAGYGESLRGFLSSKSNPLKLIDFGGTKVFSSATVDVNILILDKKSNQFKTNACIIDKTDFNNLDHFIRNNSVVNSYTNGDSWIILSEIERSIKEKIEKVGKPLKEWDVEINRGILTGLNEAFIIDRNLKDILIEKDLKNKKIIVPLLRGRDIEPYIINFSDKWLINVHNGVKDKGIQRVDIDEYPIIKNHLNKFYSNLLKRNDKGDTEYNLRNCAYLESMNKDKVVWGEKGYLKFTFVSSEYFIDKTLFMITGSINKKVLCSYLNSKLISFYFYHTVPLLGEKGLSMTKVEVEQVPVIDFDKSEIKNIESLYDDFIKTNSDEILEQIDDIIIEKSGLDFKEKEYIKKWNIKSYEDV